MYVVIETNNITVKAKVKRYDNRDDGVEAIKNRYKELTKKAVYLDRERTDIDESSFSFAQVSDGMVITELYLSAC